MLASGGTVHKYASHECGSLELLIFQSLLNVSLFLQPTTLLTKRLVMLSKSCLQIASLSLLAYKRHVALHSEHCMFCMPAVKYLQACFISG